jgi:methyl-accepting chemotaxis protein
MLAKLGGTPFGSIGFQMVKFFQMKLAWKLPLLIAIPAISLIFAAGFMQLRQTGVAMEKDHEVAYRAYVNEKAARVEAWLEMGRVDVLSLADSFAIKTALTEFSAAWNEYDGDVATQLRDSYIFDNPNPLGSKDELIAATDGTAWSAIHDVHHLGLRSYQRARGYYDLFLFDTAGNLVYSVFKEDDFALDFTAGKYAESGLGEAFQQGVALTAGQFHMTDIDPYAPSSDAPAMFMSTPVYVDGVRIGVVAVQLPLDIMETIIAGSDLLGETGETYLVDERGRALTNSRHEGGFRAMDLLPQLEQIQTALSGESAFFQSVIGLDGHEVVAETSEVITPKGDHWGMVFEIDRVEANTFVDEAATTAIFELGVTAILLGLIAWLSVRGVMKRIETLTGELTVIASENYSNTITGQDKKDEIGYISSTVAELQIRLHEGAQAQEREKVVQKANAEVVAKLSEALMDLAKGDFRNTITEFFPEEHKKLRYSLNDAITGLNDVVLSVRDTADGINRGAQSIAGSADELSTRTESQAATLEQTAAAIEEITSSVRSATEHAESVEITVETARKKAEASGLVVNETIEAMTEIEKSSNQISQIITVIDDIAFQTNLLALNAGVEAARAGEAGRGFAVVASEVRGLAQRSSDAAMEIKSLIETSGQQVGRGVQMVGRTGEALTLIMDQVQGISTLVGQIAQSSREQATALTEINTGMCQLDQATQGNAAMVEENTAAAHMLSADANMLIQHVGKFKTVGESSAAVPISAPEETRHVTLGADDPDDWEHTEEPEAQAANDKWTDF